ncbi:MAG TPA: transposase [Gemmatimonadaceae bacterium]
MRWICQSPDRISAEPSLLAHVAVSKYADHTPLTRLQGIYARSGVQIPVTTLVGWIAAVAEKVKPLADAIARQVLAACVVNTDSTGLKVLEPRAPENIIRGTIWCYVGGRYAAYLFTPTGEGETGPWEFLAGRTGYVQADAASVFDRVFDDQVAKAVEVGCWAHYLERRFMRSGGADPVVSPGERCDSVFA